MKMSDACAAFMSHVVERRIRDIVEDALQVRHRTQPLTPARG